MRFSTYGRGIWDYNPTASIAVPDSASGASPAGLQVTVAPNPAAARSALEFALGSAQPVEITLYDVKGRRLRTLANGMQAAGAHRLAFDLRADSGRKLASGLYLVRIVALGKTTVRRLTVVD
jgi:flagellar hook assembly protein FlgD